MKLINSIRKVDLMGNIWISHALLHNSEYLKWNRREFHFIDLIGKRYKEESNWFWRWRNPPKQIIINFPPPNKVYLWLTASSTHHFCKKGISIDRKTREIICLVASIRLSICPSVCSCSNMLHMSYTSLHNDWLRQHRTHIVTRAIWSKWLFRDIFGIKLSLAPGW